jgi:PRTRC genetic system ThiF family protein
MALRTKPNSVSTFTHHLAPELKQELVTVSLVGCGGNGSQMLHKLARLDFALRELGREGLHVTVFDGDDVSPSNIGRQLFSPDDVGLNKAVVLVHRLNMSYGLAWDARPEAFSPAASKVLRDVGSRYVSTPIRCQILVTCVDTAAARRDVWFAIKDLPSHMKPKYWLDLGNSKDSGQVIVGQPPFTNEIIAASVPVENWVAGGAKFNAKAHLDRARAEMEAKRLPCVTEVFPQLLDRRRKEDNSPSCSLAEALEKQSLFVNDQMSTWGAQLLDGLLREGKLDYHGVFVNLKTGAARPLACRVRTVEAAKETAVLRRAA